MGLGITVSAFAQDLTGGVKGTVASRAGRVPIKDALVTVYASPENRTVYTSEDGKFLIDKLADGIYRMTVEASGYYTNDIEVKVQNGTVNDLFVVTLSPESVATPEMDDAMFIEQETSNENGYQATPSILYNPADVYDNIVGYTFSAMRFRNRGYETSTEDIYMNGVRMNDAMTGYTPYSLWSGLNEATRSQESVHGISPLNYGIGGYNGMTSISARASSVRKGWRFSVLTSSGQYRFRVMGTYASGFDDNGWAYSLSFSTRQGGNDYATGVYYNSLGYYLGIEKRFGGNDKNTLGLTVIGAPVERGAQNASTQEVYDIMGSNYYNSNWGFQNGKVRNARVHNNHEPVIILNYDFKPSEQFSLA
ncbi:MAG: carboxypeptidase-like regulatory domain-containing protein, partial [Bacteroidales bacterium]